MMFSTLLNTNNNEGSESVRSKLYVKYMVCLRDEMALKSVLDDMDLKCSISVHGAIECLEDISDERRHKLRMGLAKSGMVLLDEKESMLIDRIIHTIVEIVHYTDTLPKLSYRDIISKYLISNNESILKIFSDVKGMSVLQFIVFQKIERVKELLLYEDLSLEEIADKLNYKNQDYLIAQFKKMTGLTPSYFERLKKERMKIAQEDNKASHSSAADTGS